MFRATANLILRGCTSTAPKPRAVRAVPTQCGKNSEDKRKKERYIFRLRMRGKYLVKLIRRIVKGESHMADSPYSFISKTNSHTQDFSIPRCARRQLGLPVSVNISGIKICTSALHKQIDRSLCLIYIDPTVLHRNVHKSDAELLYFIRRIIRHLRNGLPFDILKCTTGCREKRQPVFYQISHCSGELSRFEKSCQAR